MDLKAVEYLMMLDDERNITKAAERLSLSQSTLSSFLLNLERNIGKALFVRRRNTLIPTKAGEIYLDSVKQMANIKLHTYQAIRALGDPSAEKITIGATPNRGSRIMMDVYPAIMKKFPRLRLEILEGNAESLRRKLLDNRVDLILSGIAALSDQRFSFVKMNREEILLSVHESFPLALRGRAMPGNQHPVIRAGDLSDTPLVLMSKGTAIRELSDSFLSKADYEPTVICESEDIRFACSLIQRGAGAGFVPLHFLRETRNTKSFSLDPRVYMDLGVLYLKGKVLNPVERFVLYLICKREARISSDMPPLAGETVRLIREFEG